MRQLLKAFLQDGSERIGWTASTIHSYGSHVGGFLDWAAARMARPAEIADYSAALLQTYDTARKRAGKAQRSRSAAVCAWQSFARYLLAHGHITQEDCTAIAGLKVRVTEKPRQRWATACRHGSDAPSGSSFASAAQSATRTAAASSSTCARLHA